MNKPERVKVVANEPAESGPYSLVCTDLDTGAGVVLRYWRTHRGEDGDVPNPAMKMEPGKCYRVGLRFSSRKGYDDEYMVRECEEIPDEAPPRVLTKDEHILLTVCLKEAGEALRCDQTINGGPYYSAKAQIEMANELFRGMLDTVESALLGKGEKQR